MTYEEAKMQIQAIPEKIWDQLSEPDREAMEMAFSALQAQEAKTQLSAEGTTSDLISRQDAIDAECEVCQIAPKKERGHNCTYYVHGCKEIECLRELPSAQPEIEERTEEFAQNVPKEDLISRKAAIDALWEIRQEEISDGRRFHNHCSLSTAVDVIKDLPSAQPEIKPISYQDCANAMMMMWIDNVLTDGEYRRIMDKLNDHESRKENR